MFIECVRFAAQVAARDGKERALLMLLHHHYLREHFNKTRGMQSKTKGAARAEAGLGASIIPASLTGRGKQNIMNSEPTLLTARI